MLIPDKELFRLDFYPDYAEHPIVTACLWGDDAQKVVRHFHQDDPRRRVRVRIQAVDLSNAQTPEGIIQTVEERVYRNFEK